ncbi:MAG TPA: DUF4266 domain-containing protein [Nitrospiria bacterium]|nr:DUF4266 domain-containing protein [Nitrospiria bacterium]
MKSLFWLLMGLMIALTGVSGCASVKPWEREYLADETMQFDPDPLMAQWYQHVREIREGGRGGFNGTGGGCGCR